MVEVVVVVALVVVVTAFRTAVPLAETASHLPPNATLPSPLV